VQGTIHILDPNLCNNADLVRLLEAWVSTWELASSYVVNAPRRDSICDLVTYIFKAECLVPELKAMRDECSAELFLVLPRLLLLRFLARPSALAHLLNDLLPHHTQKFSSVGHMRFDAELSALINRFQRIQHLLGSAIYASSEPRELREQAMVDVLGEDATAGHFARSLLTRRAVLGLCCGPNELEGAIGGTEPHLALEEVSAFFRELEAWSMKMQRRHARAWNGFSAVLLHCLNKAMDDFEYL